MHDHSLPSGDRVETSARVLQSGERPAWVIAIDGGFLAAWYRRGRVVPARAVAKAKTFPTQGAPEINRAMKMLRRKGLSPQVIEVRIRFRETAGPQRPC